MLLHPTMSTQLRSKSQKTIVAVFQMLRTLCVVLGGGLDQHMPSLLESTHRCLQDKNQVRVCSLSEVDHGRVESGAPLFLPCVRLIPGGLAY